MRLQCTWPLWSAVLFFTLGFAEQAADRLVLEHADVLEGRKQGSAELRRLKGNVRFRQGNAILTCDEAEQYLDEGRTVLSGGVAFVDSFRALYGDRVTYDERRRVTCIEGSAKLVDSVRTLKALRICYDDVSEKAAADEEVSLTDEKERTTVYGDHADYDRAVGYARIVGRPRLVRSDSSGIDLTIRGRIFEVFDEGQKIVVSDSVEVRRGDLTAWCDTLVFLKSDNVVVLSNKPRVRQGRQRLSGTDVRLLLQGNEVRGIEIVGSAAAAAPIDSTVSADLPYDLLTGERMMVWVSDENIDSVRVTGRATSFYHVVEEGVEKGLNKVLGDTLFIAFSGRRIQRVRVSSAPAVSKGEFTPPSIPTQAKAELRRLLDKLGAAIQENNQTGEAVLPDGRTGS